MLDPGYKDTIQAKKKIDIPDLSWNTDFAPAGAQSSAKGNEIVLVNLTSPIGREEKIKTNSSVVNDVFTPAGINAAYTPASKGGRKVYSQISDVYRYSDPESDTEVHLPITASISLTIPNSELLTADDVLIAIGRAVSSLFDTGSTASVRINRVLRGSMGPK